MNTDKSKVPEPGRSDQQMPRLKETELRKADRTLVVNCLLYILQYFVSRARPDFLNVRKDVLLLAILTRLQCYYTYSILSVYLNTCSLRATKEKVRRESEPALACEQAHL